MAGLIAPYMYLNAGMAIVGTIITLYTFLQRFLKDQLLVSEVMASLAIGVAIGPAGLNLLDPLELGEAARFQTMIQISKVVIAIQLVSAGLSLPMYYAQREWQSLVVLIGPVMVLTWFLSFGFTVAIIGRQLSTLQALMLAATLTPTDPVLASSILQGKFAERHLPAPLRYILSAESGANDGMALPFVLLPMLLIDEKYSTGEAIARWFWQVWGWDVLLAVAIGLAYGITARMLLRIGTKYDLIDEPSHLAHIIGMALGTLGFTHIFGSDGVLSVFVASIAFSIYEPTAEEKRYDAMNGIELILTITYFIYFGTTLPLKAWQEIGVGRLILLSAALLVLRRLPVVVAFAELVPEFGKRPGGRKAIYAQAAYAGFFGPLGVGAIFYAVGLYDELKDTVTYNYVSFVVVASVVVHGILAAPLSMLLDHFLSSLTTEHHLTAITLEEMVNEVSMAAENAARGSSIGRTTVRSPGKERDRRPTLSHLSSWSNLLKEEKAGQEENGAPPPGNGNAPPSHDGRIASGEEGGRNGGDGEIRGVDVMLAVDELVEEEHELHDGNGNGGPMAKSSPKR